MTRVLVTGATTPVGLAVVKQLAREPRIERIVAVQRPGESSAGLEQLEKVRVEPTDLTRPRQIHGLLFGAGKVERCDTVLHLAAHRAARDEGNRVHALNVESTRQLIALSMRHPSIQRFVLRSYAEVYRVRPHHATILREDHPLDLRADAPQWIRDRIEADLIACAAVGTSELQVAVMRCAECPAPHSGSQLWEYLQPPVCFTPLGFDPMINLISIADLTGAMTRMALSNPVGVFNVPGADTYPLSLAIQRAGRRRVPMPDRLLDRIYRLGVLSRHSDFRYDQNHFRFRFSGVLDGTKIKNALDFVPHTAIDWRASMAAGNGLAAAS